MKRFVIDYVVAATFRNLTMYEYMRQCTCRMRNVYIEAFRLYRQYMYIYGMLGDPQHCTSVDNLHTYVHMYTYLRMYVYSTYFNWQTICKLQFWPRQ